MASRSMIVLWVEQGGFALSACVVALLEGVAQAIRALPPR